MALSPWGDMNPPWTVGEGMGELLPSTTVCEDVARAKDGADCPDERRRFELGRFGGRGREGPKPSGVVRPPNVCKEAD